MKLPKFWEGWQMSVLNVAEEAPLHMHLINLLVILFYPLVYVGLLIYNKSQAKKRPN